MTGLIVYYVFSDSCFDTNPASATRVTAPRLWPLITHTAIRPSKGDKEGSVGAVCTNKVLLTL